MRCRGKIRTTIFLSVEGLLFCFCLLSSFAGQAVAADFQQPIVQQISACWNVPVGGGVQGKAVSVVVNIGADRVIKSAEITNKDRYESDPYYKSMADSVIRALRNPKCSPLNLPADKYEEWKQVTLTFDPQDML